MYVDTSALVSLYIPEEKSAKCQQLLQDADSPAISTLTEVEFCSAVARRVRMREIQREDGHCIISMFRLHLKTQVFRMLPFWQKEYDLARDWIASFDFSLRTLDALHLGIAFSNDLALLTADKSLAKSASTLGLQTVHLR